MTTVKDLKESVLLYLQSTEHAHQTHLNLLEEVLTDNEYILDPSNPWLLSQLSAAAMASAAIEQDDINSRKMYPILARSFRELYPHMSAPQFKERFSSPATNGKMRIILSVEELKEVAVYENGVGTMVIGKDTEWRVGNMAFYHHYPIVILLQANDNYQVYFDVSVPTPLKDSRNNAIQSTLVRMEGNLALQLEVPVDQLKLIHKEFVVTESTGMVRAVDFSDQYHFARVYNQNNQGSWEEITTTHAAGVYDRSKPTAVLTVEDGVLIVEIPEIYLTTGQVGQAIRVDLFTTKGAVDQDLSVISTDGFEVGFRDYDNLTPSPTGAMGNLSTLSVYSVSRVRGGHDGLDFDLMREMVIYGDQVTSSPIFYRELKQQLNRMGYRLTVLEEHVLGRKYLATRDLPLPENGLYSRIGTSVESLVFDKGDSSILTGVVASNQLPNTRFVITPETLFLRENSNVSILPGADRAALDNMSGEFLVSEMNNKSYLFSPFYTIMDESNDLFGVRSYYFDAPSVEYRQYIDSNEDVPYVVNTLSMSLTKVNGGFNMQVVTAKPKDMEELWIVPTIYNEKLGSRYYLDVQEVDPADYSGTRAIFNISLETLYDVTKDHEIVFDNVKDVAGNIVPNIPLDLLSAIELVYVSTDSVATGSTFDDLFTESQTASGAIGVTHERVGVRFGDNMANLYTEGRAIRNPPVYQTYQTYAFKQYDEDMFDRNPDGSIAYTLDGNDEPVFTKLHSVGDYVLIKAKDELGNPLLASAGQEWVYSLEDGEPIKDENGDTFVATGGEEYYQYDREYDVGDTVYSNGEPVIDVEDTLSREITLPLFDARYQYAQTQTMRGYLKEAVGDVVNYIKTDIESVERGLLERSELPFAPTNSYTRAAVINSAGEKVFQDTALSFTIDITLTPEAFKQDAKREQAADICLSAISETISKEQVSLSTLYKNIMDSVSTDVVNVDILPFLPNKGYAKLQYPRDQFSVKSKLVLLSNGNVDVVDDVTFTYSST